MLGLVAVARIARLTLLAVIPVAIMATTLDAQNADTVPRAPDSVGRAADRELPWPRTVRVGSTTLTISQPQVDSWDGFTLVARVAVRAASSGQTSYGIVTLDARTLTDLDERLVVVDRARVVSARFTGVDKELAARWGAAVAAGLTSPEHAIALDRLETALAATDVTVEASSPLDNSPPNIVFATQPTILVRIDGDPVYRPVANSSLSRLINTRVLILRDENGALNLKLFDGWVRASSLRGPWHRVERPSTELERALLAARIAGTVDELSGRSERQKAGPSLEDRIPAIHIATSPTELIVTDGPGNWTPVHGANVFYMLNTTARVLKSGQDFKIYALIAGRWFRTSNIFGTWDYVTPAELPSQFSKIPDRSPIENVKASIPGTKQAGEAAVSTTIAHTMRVIASTAPSLAPYFDGTAEFKTIEGTSLEYAVNSATPVIRNEGRLYALESGVWYTTPGIDSPWRIAFSIPEEVHKIPPTSRIYYATFVHVLATSGDTVFVGQFPGYRGTYVERAGKVIVYGTGYDYHSWLARAWFGAPQTYGFGSDPTFTPWSGWTIAFGFGWAWGDAVLANGRGWGVYPWWQPSNARVLQVASNAALGTSYNSRTGIASAGQRGAIEDLAAETGIVQAREVAVTPTGTIIPARSGGFFRVREGDRVEFLGGTKRTEITEVRGTTRTVTVRERSAGGTVVRSEEETFAGRDGRVYRHTERGWEARGEEGWEAARQTDAMLDEANAMRETANWRLGMARQSMRSRP